MSEITENISEVRELVEKRDGEVSKVLDKLDKVRKDIVSENSEHLAKLNELENRIEELELDYKNEEIHDEALANRIDEIESEVEGLESVENLNNRLKELENELSKISENSESHIDNIVADKLHPHESRIEELESQMHDADEAFEELFEHVLHLSEIVREGFKKENSYEYGM